MRQSSTDQTLFEYIKNNRGRLDINEFKKILANGNLNDESNKLALLHLVNGGGTFNFAQLLIISGYNPHIVHDGKTPLHIAATQNQGQLLFLLLAFYHNHPKITLPDDLKDTPKIRLINQFLKFEHESASEFGAICQKLISNYFDFDCLSREENDFLNKIKNSNVQDDSDNDSLSDSLSNSSIDGDTKIKPQKPPGLGELFSNNQDLIAIAKNFITNFASYVNKNNKKFELEDSNNKILTDKSGTPIIEALQKHLKKESQLTINDLVLILAAKEKENVDPQFIEATLETIDSNKLTLQLETERVANMISKSLARRGERIDTKGIDTEGEVKNTKKYSEAIIIPIDISRKIAEHIVSGDIAIASKTTEALFVANTPEGNPTTPTAQTISAQDDKMIVK